MGRSVPLRGKGPRYGHYPPSGDAVWEIDEGIEDTDDDGLEADDGIFDDDEDGLEADEVGGSIPNADAFVDDSSRQEQPLDLTSHEDDADLLFPLGSGGDIPGSGIAPLCIAPGRKRHKSCGACSVSKRICSGKCRFRIAFPTNEGVIPYTTLKSFYSPAFIEERLRIMQESGIQLENADMAVKDTLERIRVGLLTNCDEMNGELIEYDGVLHSMKEAKIAIQLKQKHQENIGKMMLTLFGVNLSADDHPFNRDPTAIGEMKWLFVIYNALCKRRVLPAEEVEVAAHEDASVGDVQVSAHVSGAEEEVEDSGYVLPQDASFVDVQVSEHTEDASVGDVPVIVEDLHAENATAAHQVPENPKPFCAACAGRRCPPDCYFRNAFASRNDVEDFKDLKSFYSLNFLRNRFENSFFTVMVTKKLDRRRLELIRVGWKKDPLRGFYGSLETETSALEALEIQIFEFDQLYEERRQKIALMFNNPAFEFESGFWEHMTPQDILDNINPIIMEIRQR